MSKCKKKKQKFGKKYDNDVDNDMTQLERNNNKCCALSFRYIQILHKPMHYS